MKRPRLDHAREFEWLTINEHLKCKKTKTKTWNLPNRCRFTIFPLGLNFSTIPIHFFYQVKSWQNWRNSDYEQWMSDMSSGADPTRTVMTLDDETLERIKWCSPPTERKPNVERIFNRIVEFSILQKAFGLKYALFWIVPLCLSLLLHLWVADHHDRQNESSDCRNSDICSRWGIAPLTKEMGI